VAQRLGKRLGDGPHGLHALSLGHEGLRQGLGERLGQGRQGQVTCRTGVAAMLADVGRENALSGAVGETSPESHPASW